MTLKYIHSKDAPADNIVECIAAHEAALSELRKQLPVACERDGHVWDNQEGTLKTICIRKGCWVDADPECTPIFGSRGGHWAIEPEHADLYQRTCVRCGKIDRREPVRLGVKSPWSA